MVNVLETERLSLRQLTVDDAPFMLALLNEPSFLRFIGDRGVRTLAQARDYLLNGPMASYARWGYGLYLAELKTDQTPIGICGLVKRDFLPDPDIGFAFQPAFWSKGYAFEAASAVLTYAREVLQLKRIAAIVAPDNERSVRVLEKLGLRFEGWLRWPEDGSASKRFAIGL